MIHPETDFDMTAFVELGLADRSVHDYDANDPFVSRLGGVPAWLTECVDIACPVCSSKMFLLVQFDCPTDDGTEDRVLYLFGCNTKDCVLKDPQRAFKAVVQKRQARAVVEEKSANFWEAPVATVSLSSSDTSSRVEKFEDCKTVLSANSFPVVVLKIVEELIRVKRKKDAEVTAMTDAPEDAEEDDEPVVPEDEVMEEFMERVSHYPRQCVRYSPSGKILHFSQAHADAFEKHACSVCSGKNLSFLAQLMPAFLSLIQVDDFIGHIPKEQRGKHAPFGDGLEFATVMVLICGDCENANVWVELEDYQ